MPYEARVATSGKNGRMEGEDPREGTPRTSPCDHSVSKEGVAVRPSCSALHGSRCLVGSDPDEVRQAVIGTSGVAIRGHEAFEQLRRRRAAERDDETIPTLLADQLHFDPSNVGIRPANKPAAVSLFGPCNDGLFELMWI